jgi:hypothetical protein
VAYVPKRLNHRAILTYVEAEIDGCHTCRSGDTDCFVSDILHSLKVPEKYHRYACKRLYCPQCEARLYENSWIMRCDAEEQPYRQFVARCSVKYGTKLSDFERHLSRFPSLGILHRLGRSIWRAVSRFPAKTIRQERFIRVRRFNGDSELAKIKREGMGAPDPLVCAIKGGRYNHEGQSFLYMSSDEETGIAEQFDRPDSEKPLTGTCAIQEFEVRNMDSVLDLTQASHPSLLYSALVHEGTLSKEIVHSSSWKPEYLVPRFVADAARAKGFKAMLYRTCKVFFAQGLNLVIFEPKTEAEVMFGENLLKKGSIVKTGNITIWERVMRDDVGYEIVRRPGLAGSVLSRA